MDMNKMLYETLKNELVKNDDLVKCLGGSKIYCEIGPNLVPLKSTLKPYIEIRTLQKDTASPHPATHVIAVTIHCVEWKTAFQLSGVVLAAMDDMKLTVPGCKSANSKFALANVVRDGDHGFAAQIVFRVILTPQE